MTWTNAPWCCVLLLRRTAVSVDLEELRLEKPRAHLECALATTMAGCLLPKEPWLVRLAQRPPKRPHLIRKHPDIQR